MKRHTDSPLDRETVVSLVIDFAPSYLEVLNGCKSADTWGKLSAYFAEMTCRLNVRNYVLVYDDEKRVFSAVFNTFMTPDEQSEWAKSLGAMSEPEQRDAIRDFVRPGGLADEMTSSMFSDCPDDEQAQIEAFNQLNEADKQRAIKHAQYGAIVFLAWLHNMLAVMVHGERMTSLVPKALAGDEEAFLKAIHIDRNLLLDHPGFAEIHDRAIRNGDQKLLQKIARRLASPVTKGRIQLAGAFMVFALLEAMGWLDKMKHREILDICDAARLDRWQNRIEDESAVAKCISKYRRYQKTGGLSMH